MCYFVFFFFSSRRRHTRSLRDWSSDVCSSDLDPRIGEPGHRSDPGLLAEPTSERASRHVCAPRERVEVERKGKVLQHPVAKRRELIASDLGVQPFDELRLSSLTLWRRDEDPCRRVGRGGAVVASDEV